MKTLREMMDIIEAAQIDEKSSFPAGRHPETGVIIGGRKEAAKVFGGDKEYDSLADRRTPSHEVPHAKAMGWKNGDEKAEQGKLKTALKKKSSNIKK